MFIDAFSDELQKLAFDLKELAGKLVGGDGSIRDNATYRGGNETAKAYGRGAMRSVGLDPESERDKAIAAGGAVAGTAGVLSLPAMVGSSRSKRYTRKMIEAERRRVAAEAAKKAASKGGVRKVLSRLVKKGGFERPYRIAGDDARKRPQGSYALQPQEPWPKPDFTKYQPKGSHSMTVMNPYPKKKLPKFSDPMKSLPGGEKMRRGAQKQKLPKDLTGGLIRSDVHSKA